MAFSDFGWSVDVCVSAATWKSETSGPKQTGDFGCGAEGDGLLRLLLVVGR